MAKVVSSNAIVLELLDEDNYFKWSTLMKTYFVAKDLWDVVEGNNNVEIQNPTGTKIEERTRSHKVEDRCDDHESTSKTKDGDDHEEPPKVLKDGVDHVPGNEPSKPEDGRPSQTADQTPKSKDGDDHHHKSQKLIKDCIIDNHDGFPKPEDGATKLAAETPESEDGDDDHHDQSPNLNKDGDGDHDGSPKPEDGNHGAISQKLEDSTKAEDLWKAWVIKNATALHAIRISCGSEAFSVIMNASTAKSAWDTLETKFKPQFLRQLPVQTNKMNDDIPAAYESFYKTVVRGDWKRAKAFVVEHPEALTARINSLHETALHVAAVYGHLRIVEELLKLMSVKDSELQQDQGYTALSLAAMAGIVPMAKCLIKKNKGLAKIKSYDGLLPVVKAIYVGHFDLARYLYYITDLDLTGQDSMNGAILLNQFILSKNFDMALDLIKRCPRLAVATGAYIVPSLVVIAMCKSAFPSGSPLAFWQNWIYKCIQIPTSSTNDTCIQISGDSTTTSEDTLVYTRGELDKEPDERIKKATTIVSGVLRGIGSYLFEFLGIKKIYELKLIHVQSQELLRCILGNLKTFMSEDRRLVTDVAHQAMFQAVEEGNVEFVIEISRTIPELIRHVDHRQRSVFSYAVECRQAEIFSLVHGFVILKEEIAAITDDYGNTVLHMAGKLAPSSHLSRISGAALQMQRELQWFKEVESILQNN